MPVEYCRVLFGPLPCIGESLRSRAAKRCLAGFIRNGQVSEVGVGLLTFQDGSRDLIDLARITDGDEHTCIRGIGMGFLVRGIGGVPYRSGIRSGDAGSLRGARHVS